MRSKRLLSVFLILLLLLAHLPAGAVAYAAEDAGEPETVTHSVVLQRNDGGEPEQLTVPDGETLSEPTQPERENYAFAGWYADAELTQLYSFDAPVTADLNLYAAWTRQSYTVTFACGEGGGEIPAQTVAAGDPVQRPADPRLEELRFDAWYSDEALSEPYDFAAPVTADLTLYAGWLLQEDAGGGNNADGDADDNADADADNDEDNDDDNANDTADNSDKADVPLLTANATSKSAQLAAAPAAAAAVQYPLILNAVPVTDANKDDILGGGTASFDPNSSTLTLNGAVLTQPYYDEEASTPLYWAGVGLLTITGTATVNITAADSVGICTEGALLFSGADLTVRGGDFGVLAGGYLRLSNSTLTAAGSLAAVYAGGGIRLEGVGLKEPADGAIGDTFILGADGAPAAAVKLEKGVSLTPAYQVRFEPNGGSPQPASQTVTAGQKAAKPVTPARAGHRFVCWCSDQALNTAYNFDSPITANLTLYAKWQPTVTVRFDYNDGSGDIGQQTVDKGATVSRLERSRYNYLLEGWYSDKELTKAFDFKAGVTADLTLYAKWKPLYTITAGKDVKWYVGSDKDISLTVKRSADDENCILYFTGVSIDGSKQLLEAKHYAVSSGSTVLRLKNAYLKTLEPGKHKVTVHFQDGYLETNFTVHKGVPTGDEREPAFWLGMMMVSAACSSLALFALALDRRRS